MVYCLYTVAGKQQPGQPIMQMLKEYIKAPADAAGFGQESSLCIAYLLWIVHHCVGYTVEPLIATPPSSGNLRIAYTILGTDLHRRLHCILATSQERKPPNSE